MTEILKIVEELNERLSDEEWDAVSKAVNIINFNRNPQKYQRLKADFWCEFFGAEIKESYEVKQ